MIETIRTFFGKLRGQHQNKETVIVEGKLWRCTDCKTLFMTEHAAKDHACTGKI